MCRMLGYLGEAVPLASLVTAPPHSLYVQSFKPREMQSGVVNADGYGAAMWLDDGRPEPAVYRTAAPIWADGNLAWMGERLRVRTLLAAVRSATPGIGYDLGSVQPFSRGRVAFLHNGYIANFRSGPQRALREGLGPAAYEAVLGGSDSEHLFGLVLDALDRGAADLAQAVRGGLSRLSALCAGQAISAVASVVVSDGVELVGARFAHGANGATLYLGARPGGGSLGYCMASEPLDGEQASAWRSIPEGHLARVRRGAVPVLEPLA